MSTVSKLPGRLRFEIKELFNKKRHCSVLELKILEIKGVMEAEANHRTGRLLVVFDEAVIDSHELASRIREILDKISDCQNVADISGIREKKNGISSTFVHAVIDIAGHMLMPKPLGILVPIAINAMRKNL